MMLQNAQREGVIHLEKLIDLDFDGISTERALGVLLNPGTDVMQIKVTAKNVSLNEWEILSSAESVFDSLGILAAIILEASKL